ncbi:UNVERIFIED_CONTAM: hypothetical protein Sindi_1687600 [Sesamum indicum]
MALAKVVKYTRHLTPSIYLCSRAAFSKRERCYWGSVDLSYSAIAGVRQFAGSSSAITISVKGILYSSFQEFLLFGVARLGDHFEDTSKEPATVGDPPVDLLEGALAWRPFLLGEFLPFLLEGCLVPAQRLDEESSPVVVSKEVLHLGGSTKGSMILGDSIKAEKAAIDTPTGVREASATTCRS